MVVKILSLKEENLCLYVDMCNISRHKFTGDASLIFVNDDHRLLVGVARKHLTAAQTPLPSTVITRPLLIIVTADRTDTTRPRRQTPHRN